MWHNRVSVGASPEDKVAFRLSTLPIGQFYRCPNALMKTTEDWAVFDSIALISLSCLSRTLACCFYMRNIYSKAEVYLVGLFLGGEMSDLNIGLLGLVSRVMDGEALSHRT